MKCERCGQREATYYYRENINGKETKAHLCSVCASEKESSFSLGDFFSGGIVGQMLSPTPMEKHKRAENKRCSLCSCDFSYIAKTGKAGCPQCYIDFAPLMEDALKRLHGNTVHKGRIPREYREKLGTRLEQEQLEKQLREAIAAEEYERAAVIRDKIRSLNSEM